MNFEKINTIEKNKELKKYRDIVIATIDYFLENDFAKIKTTDFDSDEHYKKLKTQTDEHFQKGRLTKLKQWFRDLTEPQIESGDLNFNKYLKEKTNYDIDLFKSYFDRVDKIIEKGKITTDNQFYDLSIMVDKLCQIEPIDQEKIKKINKLLTVYELSKKIKKPTA
jgi:hypothetical protein